MKNIFINGLAIVIAFNSVNSFASSGTGLLFNTSTSNNILNISTVTKQHTYPNAGIKINTPGYNLAGVGTECINGSNGYCLFAVSDTQAKNISISGNTGKISVTLCLNGIGRLSCQNYDNLTIQATPVSQIAKFAYIANETGNAPVSVCALDPNSGVITACQSAGGGGAILGINPQGVALNSAGTMAYLSGEFGSPIAFQCPINSVDGTFNTCTATTITSPTGYYAYYGMLTINPLNTLAYLVDYHTNGGQRVLACPLTAGNISSTCSDAGISATNLEEYPTGITLNQAGTVAYIAHPYGGGSFPGVTVCNVNGASFTGCINKNGGGSITFAAPGDVALNSTGSILYVTDNTNNAVYACSTTPNNTSLFDNCVVASSGITGAWGIAVNAKSTIAYVTDYGANVYQCPILSDNTFSACTANSSFNGTVGIALAY